MSWVEVGQTKLPKELQVAQVLEQDGAFFIRTAPQRGKKSLLLRWDVPIQTFSWELELPPECAGIFSASPHLLVRGGTPFGARRSPEKLYALNPVNGLLLWEERLPLLAVTAARGRIYTIEKRPGRAFQFVTYNGDTGKRLISDMAYDQFTSMSATEEGLVAWASSLRVYLLSFEGEPLFESEWSSTHSVVAPDGGICFSVFDQSTQDWTLYWMQPKTYDLWSLPFEDKGYLCSMSATQTTGCVFYTRATKTANTFELTLYDWERGEPRWQTQRNFGKNAYYHSSTLTPFGILITVTNRPPLLLDEKTHQEMVLPLSSSNFWDRAVPGYFWTKSRCFVQRERELCAFAWKP